MPLEDVIGLLLQDLGELELHDLGVDVRLAELRLNQLSLPQQRRSPDGTRNSTARASLVDAVLLTPWRLGVGLREWFEVWIERKVRRRNGAVATTTLMLKNALSRSSWRSSAMDTALMCIAPFC